MSTEPLPRGSEGIQLVEILPQLISVSFTETNQPSLGGECQLGGLREREGRGDHVDGHAPDEDQETQGDEGPQHDPIEGSHGWCRSFLATSFSRSASSLPDCSGSCAIRS